MKSLWERHVLKESRAGIYIQSNVEEKFHKKGAMEKRHGGNVVPFLTLRKLFHMVRHASAMPENGFQSNVEEILPNRERHGGAMGAPCHGKAPWEKNVSILMLRKPFHKECHASAMEKKFVSNVEKTNRMGRHGGAPCMRHVGIKFHSILKEKPSHDRRHGSAMSAPWERHVMQERHGGKMFFL